MAKSALKEKQLAPGQWSKDIEPAGTLHGPTTLFMSSDCGKATAEDGDVFQLSTQGWGPGAPLVKCERTGLTFTLSWTEIVRMAIEAGITKDHPDMEGK